MFTVVVVRTTLSILGETSHFLVFRSPGKFRGKSLRFQNIFFLCDEVHMVVCVCVCAFRTGANLLLADTYGRAARELAYLLEPACCCYRVCCFLSLSHERQQTQQLCARSLVRLLACSTVLQ